MTAKDGKPTGSRERQRGALLAVGGVLCSLLASGCSQYFHVPRRPTVEQLMQTAISKSAQGRAEQQAVVAANSELPTIFAKGSSPSPSPAEPAPIEPAPVEPTPLSDLPSARSLPKAAGPAVKPKATPPKIAEREPTVPLPKSMDEDDAPPAPFELRELLAGADPAAIRKRGRVRIVQHESLPPPAADDSPPRISEEFFETDVREAVSILASEVEADVLMDDTVRGVVNTTITDATFDEALEKVLLPLGFVFGRRGEQYIISPPNPEAPLFPYLSSRVEYRPRHVEAETLLAAPPAQMARFVRVVEGANLLLIEAPTQFADLILERVQALDQPTPQVELEAIVCVVAPDSGFRFGLDWGHAVTINGNDALNLGASGLALSGTVSSAGLRNLFSDFTTTSAFVQLLADNGYLSIRAAPRVMAQDGEKANISINQESYFTLQPGNQGGDNSAFFFQQDIEKVESGISLEITPHVRGNEVTVEIAKAEVSEDIRTTTADLAGNSLPVINRRSVSTTVHVEDGKTIIIGGLMQRETVNRTNHVPGLSRLPGVGYFFKSIEKQLSETEVVIFISPRIVTPESAGSAPCPTCPPP